MNAHTKGNQLSWRGRYIVFISYSIYATSCVFYIPEPLVKGYKTRNEVHKYPMKWKFILDSFYHMLNSLKYKKRLLLRCIHHFKSDLINNMDHMRISGTEPSSVKMTKNTVWSSFLTDFTAENAPTSWRYLWSHRRTATSQPIKKLPGAMP